MLGYRNSAHFGAGEQSQQIYSISIHVTTGPTTTVSVALAVTIPAEPYQPSADTQYPL